MKRITYSFTFGRMVREAREKLGLKPSYVAKAIGVSDTALSDWEKGLASPSLDNALNLAKFLGISLDELLIPNSLRGKNATVPDHIELRLRRLAKIENIVREDSTV